jgi:hypothetical protein
LPLRFPSATDSYDIYDSENIILVVGDSISFGYGHSYEDIFWRGWERIMELQYRHPPKIISLSAYGNNFVDNVLSIKEAIQKFENKSIKIKAIIYQFNYNDLLPYTKSDLREQKHLAVEESWIWQFAMPLRQKYLNRSVFQRVFSHHMAKLFRGKATDCRERVPYPYTFGPIGFQEQSERAWKGLESGLANVRRSTKNIPFFILISPIASQFEEATGYTPKSKPLLHCATIDPRVRLAQIGEILDIAVVDPTDYMVIGFQKRVEEGNPVPFFFLGDPNHLNEIGSKYLSEYSYIRIIKAVLDATSGL